MDSFIPSVVKYNDDYYLLYAMTSNGSAKLIKSDGLKYSGTPKLDKLKHVKDLHTTSFNGHDYILTTQGIFSCSTGKFIMLQNIWDRFEMRLGAMKVAIMCNTQRFEDNINRYNGLA